MFEPKEDNEMLDKRRTRTTPNGVSSIFVTNNGLGDHIGVSQILPYLEGLAAKGHKLSCISVENPDRAILFQNQVEPRLKAAGINHFPLMRSDHPAVRKLERLFMNYRLRIKLEQVIEESRCDLLHCRSYMPVGAVLRVSKQKKIPFIFDMRGFWIDERVESNVWPHHRIFWKALISYFRRLERRALRDCSAIVVLTQDASRVVQQKPSYNGSEISVIPCSVNQEKFGIDRAEREKFRKEFGFTDADLVLAYLGSAGPLYRIDILYKLVERLKSRGESVRILFIGDHRAEDHFSRAQRMGLNLVRSDFRCVSVPHHEVPSILNAADFGVSFRISSFSSLGVSATKVGEYFSCGLPVISSRGIGDIDKIVNHGKSGLVLANFDEEEIEKAIDQILDRKFDSPEKIRADSIPTFNMKFAIEKYDDLYREVSKDSLCGCNDFA